MGSWLQQLAAAWLPSRRQAAVPVAAAALAGAAAEAPAPSKPQAEHLICMVHGLFGTRDNWTAIKGLLEQHLDPETTLLFVSHCNEREKTFEGIDACGERLADEIVAVAAQHPGLRRISLLGHSMGGLISRYAAGRLYDPAARTVAGLQPCHFVAMATPHLGCDSQVTPAQVPLISWLSAVPAVGGVVHGVVSELAGPVSSLAMGRVGLQFFLMDGGSSGSSSGNGSSGSNGSGGGGVAAEPLLYRLSKDCPEQGLLFYSALAAFETRTLYANSSGDHLVGWANSSLRRLAELPPKSGRGTGVIREDPLEAAWSPQQRPALHATPAAAQLHSSEAHQASRQAILAAQDAGQLVATSSSGGGERSGGCGGQPGPPPSSSSLSTTLAEAGVPAPATPTSSGSSGALVGPSGQPESEVERRLEEMLSRLQSLSWRRVDVCFGATALPLLSHQHIQMQRWWANWPGKTTIKHLALQLQAMEQLRQAQQARDASAQQPTGSRSS